MAMTKRERHHDPARPEVAYLLLDTRSEDVVGRILKHDWHRMPWSVELECRTDRPRFRLMGRAQAWADTVLADLRRSSSAGKDHKG